MSYKLAALFYQFNVGTFNLSVHHECSPMSRTSITNHHLAELLHICIPQPHWRPRISHPNHHPPLILQYRSKKTPPPQSIAIDIYPISQGPPGMAPCCRSPPTFSTLTTTTCHICKFTNVLRTSRSDWSRAQLCARCLHPLHRCHLCTSQPPIRLFYRCWSCGIDMPYRCDLLLLPLPPTVPRRFSRCVRCLKEYDGTEERIWKQKVVREWWGDELYDEDWGYNYKVVDEEVMEGLLREEEKQRAGWRRGINAVEKRWEERVLKEARGEDRFEVRPCVEVLDVGNE